MPEPEQSIRDWFSVYPQVFSATLASLLLLFGSFLFIPRTWRLLSCLSCNLFLTLLVLADLVHTNYYGDVISVWRWSMVPMLPLVKRSILYQLQPVHAIFFLDILIAIAVSPLYMRACQRIPPFSLISIKRLYISSLLAAILLTAPTARVVIQDKNGLFAYTSLQRDICAVIGLLPYHVVDIFIYLASSQQTIDESERQRILLVLDDHQQRSKPPSSLFGRAAGRNVIQISAESLQAFTIGLKIDGQPVTPRLSTFVRESIYFANFYDQTYLGTTADGEFSSLQSLHPLPVGAVATSYPENKYRALPAILSERGYKTFSAVGAPGGFWNMDKMHTRLGFQRSYFEDSFRIAEHINGWLPDTELFRKAISLFGEHKEPFMAHLLSSTNHGPWELPEKYHTLKLGALEGTLLGNYLHSVHYFDNAFGEFIDQLRQSGTLDKSLIVLYGDHQAFLGKLPEIAHILGFPEYSEFDYLMTSKRVPLIIRLPYGEGAGLRQTTGGHLDIAPTLLSLLGIVEKNVMLGTDLIRDESHSVAFRDGSFIDDKILFVNRFGPISGSTCYERASRRKVDCTPYDGQRRKIREQLEASDLIIRGNLIPELQSKMQSRRREPGL